LNTIFEADASKRRKLQASVIPGGGHINHEKEACQTTRFNSFFGLASEMPQKKAQKEKEGSDLLNHFPLLGDRRIEPYQH
jgi:hypothetical protein